MPVSSEEQYFIIPAGYELYIPEENSEIIAPVAHPETGTRLTELQDSAISIALISENVPTNTCTSGSAQISCSGSTFQPTIVKVENEENSVAQFPYSASQQPVLVGNNVPVPLTAVKSENTSTSTSPSISETEITSKAISGVNTAQNVHLIPAGYQFDLPNILRSSTSSPSIAKFAADLAVPNFKSTKPFVFKSGRPNVLKPTRHVFKPPKSPDFMAPHIAMSSATNVLNLKTSTSSNAINSTLENLKPNQVECLNIGFEENFNITSQSEKPSTQPQFLRSYSSAVTNSPTDTKTRSSPLFVVQDTTESCPSSGLPYVKMNVDNSTPVPLLLTKALALSKAKDENVSCGKRPWTQTLKKLKHIESTNETTYVFANPPTSTNVEKPKQTQNHTSTSINVQKPKQTKSHKTTATLCSVCNIGKLQEPSSRPQVKKMVSKFIQTFPSERDKKCQTEHLANFKKRSKGTTCKVCITESIGVQFPPNSRLPDFTMQNWLLDYSDHPSSSSESEEDCDARVFPDFSKLSQLPTIQYRILH